MRFFKLEPPTEIPIADQRLLEQEGYEYGPQAWTENIYSRRQNLEHYHVKCIM